jgi:hypothetical protein
MRSILLSSLLSVLFCGSSDYLKAQNRALLPGVTDEIVSAIQTQVNTIISDKYQVVNVLNVDSSLGGGLGPRWPDVGSVEDPYGTLTHCFVFSATRGSGATAADSASGIVGVFKAGQILWHSNGTLTVGAPGMAANSIWVIKDINRDGRVDILTTWISGSMGANPPMYLWIFSWDGRHGTIINSRHEDKQSSLMIDSYALFSLADIEGDGIWEIQGSASLYDGGALRSVYRTFSWNGSQYGLWPGVPQPTKGSSYPQDRLAGSVIAEITPLNGKFQYRYRVQSLSSSLQDIQTFAIDRFTDTVAFGPTRKCWEGTLPWLNVVSWKCYGVDGFNYIRPGEKDSTFTFTTEATTLPRVVKFYAQGWNGESDEDITLNSFRGWTIGPGDPPSQFLPTNFLDTLSSYSTQSRTMGWITTQQVSDKYRGYFATAKSQLLASNTAGARTTLQSVLQDVNVDSTSNLTSEAYALIRYNTQYLLGQLPAAPPPSGLSVKLVNSSGTNLTSGSLQYYDGSWKDAINNNDGTFKVSTNLKSVSLRMTYEGGSQTKSNVPVGPNVVVFQTVNTQVKLQNSTGMPIDTGSVQYYYSSWQALGRTMNGAATKELLPANYTFRMTYATATNDKQQDIGTNPTVVFTTVSAAVQLKNSQGNFIDQGTVQYYFSSWQNLGTTTNGVATKELLPGNYTFRMTYAFATNDKQQNIGTAPTVVFSTVNAMVQLKNSLGSFIDQGTVQYYFSSWQNLGTTTNGVVTKELLPGSYTFRMTYETVTNDKVQNIATSSTVGFATVLCTVRVKNAQGQPVDGAQVSYYFSSWRSIGATVTGQLTKELLPASLTFRETIGSATQNKVQNVGTSSLVEFIVQ